MASHRLEQILYLSCLYEELADTVDLMDSGSFCQRAHYVFEAVVVKHEHVPSFVPEHPGHSFITVPFS